MSFEKLKEKRICIFYNRENPEENDYGYLEEDVLAFLKELEKKLGGWIDEHTVTKPAGKLIRILPFEWEDFKNEVFSVEKRRA